MKITINGIDYDLKFGYGCLRRLSLLWGLDSVQGVIDEVVKKTAAGKDLEFCIDLVRASIIASGCDDPCEDVVGDYILTNMGSLAEIVSLFSASLPQVAVNETGKQKAARAAKK